MKINGLYQTFEDNLVKQQEDEIKYQKNKNKRKRVKIESALAKSISRILHLITDIVAYALAVIGVFALINPDTQGIILNTLKALSSEILNLF